MAKFHARFEKLKGVRKAVYIPSKLHLTIFYDESEPEEAIKRAVLAEIEKSALQLSVDTLSFYSEDSKMREVS